MVSDWRHDGCIDEGVNFRYFLYAVFTFSTCVLVFVPLLTMKMATVVLVSNVNVALKPLKTAMQAGVGFLQPVFALWRYYSLICVCVKLQHTIRRLCRVDGRLSRC